MATISINLKDGALERPQEVIVGIDLGTTNSLVAYMKDGQPVCVKGKDGKSTLVPSIVHFAGNGEVIVGDAAKEKLVTDPANTIYSVKRLMGKSFKDLQGHEGFFGYQVIDDDTESLVKIRVKDRFYTPVELSALILKELKTCIEGELGAAVSKAVITVPAYFNDNQRQATRDAGKLAGLDVLRIVNEPTAAALAYGIGSPSQPPHEGRAETIAVYDLGGGTFDISILCIENGIFEVLSTNGDTFLGGDDFDRVIVDFWLKKYYSSDDFSSSDEWKRKEFGQHIRLLAEAAKKALSSAEVFEGEIDGREVSLSRTEFENLIGPLVQRTLDCCKNALRDAKLTPAGIDKVVMVGGSTRVPLVIKAVSELFQKPVFDSLDPDEVVALGAAIQADILAGNQKDLLLLDVTPLSLGIETVGGLMDVIIPRNSKIPTKAGRQYTTSVDGQKNLKISVFQGERDLVEHNRKLGEFILRGIPPMPAGLPKIDIQFILNADGILFVRARELRSNLEQHIEIRPTYGISEEEMALMLLDSIQNAQTDMQARGLLEARNEANNLLLSGDKFLKQNEDILSEQEKATTNALLNALREAAKREDKDVIHRVIEELNAYTAPLAHRAMDVTIRVAMRGKKV
ncbi:MAG: molecular chaperone DnaK [Haliscomenobacteraceae bacterium CHB4]|nr:molecular chaperone DnaK [Haliscomenobacteraceae bacterium CHB4]